jgi:Flp pilus assembly protein TadD
VTGPANGEATGPVIRCPLPRCRTDNPFDADDCARCAVPLRGFARLSAYPAFLFNQGLAAARENRLSEARGYFAAVVHWCPADTEARNALALAEHGLGNLDEARRNWEAVRERRSGDRLAGLGLSLATANPDPAAGAGDPG